MPRGKKPTAFPFNDTSPRALSDRLRDQLVNGNITHVCDVLAKLPPLVAAATAAYLYADLDNYGQGVLARALQARI